MKKILSSLTALSFLVPALAFALPGIGPRVTVDAVILEVRITEQQKFDKEGGEFLLQTQDGQTIVAVLGENAKIITEGRSSRKEAIPSDLKVGMAVRVRGWRIDESSVTASLFVITNIQNNPGLTGNGIVQAVGDSTLTVLLSSGESRTLNVTKETEVNVNYELRGIEGLSLVGKAVSYTVNPEDPSLLRVIRITGRSELKAPRPSLKEIRTIPPYVRQ